MKPLFCLRIICLFAIIRSEETLGTRIRFSFRKAKYANLLLSYLVYYNMSICT
jgi:hypothetical protein